MKALQRVTGTQDLFPEDLAKIDYVTKVFKEVCKVFDYREYETPTFEYTSLFTRGIGETTDIVNKEMFTFVPRGDSQKDSITLKPEGTASIVRLYNQHNLQSKKPPLKLFYITPCFRNERNQKGRFKEFHQFGTEILGSDAASTDAEIITLAYRFFERLGIMDDITLEINSVGGFESRKAYNEKLRESLKEDFDKLCDTCKDRYYKNPMRIIDCNFAEKMMAKNRREMSEFMETAAVVNEKTYDRYRRDIRDAAPTIQRNFIRKLLKNYLMSFEPDEIIADEKFMKPAVFIMGRQDIVTGYRDFMNMYECYPRATMLVLDGGGHQLQRENIPMFETAMKNWLGSIAVNAEINNLGIDKDKK